MKEHTKWVHSCLLNLALINDRGGYGSPRIRIFGSNLQHIVAQGIQHTPITLKFGMKGRGVGWEFYREAQKHATHFCQLPRHEHETTAVAGGVPTSIELSYRICENLTGESDRG